MEDNLTSENLSADLSVPFPSEREAEIAYGALNVDSEPKRGGVKRSLAVQEKSLNIHFEAKEPRKLRVSVNSFFEHLKLVSQTMHRFGPPR